MDASSLDKIRQCFQHIPNDDNRAKISPYTFIVCLVTAVVRDGRKRTIAGIRRQMITELGQTLARSSFWGRLAAGRLKKELAAAIPRLAHGLVKNFGVTKALLSIVGVSGIFLIDSSSITLPKDAKSNFRAPRSNVIKSALKWHLCWDLFSGASNWFCISEAVVHDRNGFPPIQILKGALVIFDLGYWDYGLLAQLANMGCYYLSRIKSNAIITITGVPARAQWKQPLGRQLFSLNLKKFRGSIVEFLGSVEFGNADELNVRVIGFWNPGAKCYHWYVTNLSVVAKLIYPLYRIRWQLELIFKAGKSSLNLADIPSSNHNIIVSLVFSSIIANLIAQPVSAYALQNADDDVKLAKSVQRAAMVFVQIAEYFRRYLLTGNKNSAQQLTEKIRALTPEFVDPNYKNRPTSMKRLALAV